MKGTHIRVGSLKLARGARAARSTRAQQAATAGAAYVLEAQLQFCRALTPQPVVQFVRVAGTVWVGKHRCWVQMGATPLSCAAGRVPEAAPSPAARPILQ